MISEREKLRERERENSRRRKGSPGEEETLAFSLSKSFTTQRQKERKGGHSHYRDWLILWPVVVGANEEPTYFVPVPLAQSELAHTLFICCPKLEGVEAPPPSSDSGYGSLDQDY